MKVEKIEKIKNKYPKFEEFNKKRTKSKIGFLAALGIAFKSKYVSAIRFDEIETQIIPGDVPIYIEPEYITFKFTTLGYIAMIIITIISSLVVKFKWKNYNLKQKKRAQIILGILFTLTILLIFIAQI